MSEERKAAERLALRLLGVVLAMGIKGFWYGNALSGLMPFVIGFGYLLSGKWKKMSSR